MNKNAPVQTEAPVIDYGWKPEFVAKSAPGAVERDLTQATLVCDLENSIEEHFHFEIPPANAPGIKNAPHTDNPALGGNTWVLLFFPTGLVLPEKTS